VSKGCGTKCKKGCGIMMALWHCSKMRDKEHGTVTKGVALSGVCDTDSGRVAVRMCIEVWHCSNRGVAQ